MTAKPSVPPPLLPIPAPARPSPPPQHAPSIILPHPAEPGGFSPPSFGFGPSPEPTADLRLRKLLRMQAERQRESLRIYEPVPGAVAFHESRAKTRIIIGSNRSGKTQTCAWDIVARVTDTHPHYRMRKKGERVYVLARDHQHLAEGIWSKLAHPGQFKILRDERTGKWRPVRPDQEYDAANKEKWRDAPPLLPERLIAPKGIAWEAKTKGVPRRVTLRNGSRITFYTANSAPRRGFSISGAWVDEECENEEWLFELYRGLVDMNGWFLYSATPQSGTHWLKAKWDEAMSPFNLERPTERQRIRAFKVLIKDNPFIDEEAKLTVLDGITDERQRKVRWEGEFSLDERIVYSEFSHDQHVVKQFWPGPDWNRYLVNDPGITCAVALFVAVAPPLDENSEPHPNAGEIHLYDEVYAQRCGAEAIALRVAARIEADPHATKEGCFVAFIQDGRAGRQTQMGSGSTIKSDYQAAFRKHGLRSRMSGSGFVTGSDNVASREEALHRLLQPTYPEGRIRLRIHDRCRGLIWELPQQTRKKDPKSGLVLEQRERKDDHATTTAEYFADYDPKWMYFPPPTPGGSRMRREFELKKQRRGATESKVHLGIPG